jgi:hypothetical protein
MFSTVQIEKPTAENKASAIRLFFDSAFDP